MAFERCQIRCHLLFVHLHQTACQTQKEVFNLIFLALLEHRLPWPCSCVCFEHAIYSKTCYLITCLLASIVLIGGFLKELVPVLLSYDDSTSLTRARMSHCIAIENKCP